MTCADWKDLLLDDLYGLLDPAQAQALHAHVASCADCQAALAVARKQKATLARAALAIPNVPPFHLPEADAPKRMPKREPVLAYTAKQTTPSSLRRYWPAWTAAAAVLFAVVLSMPLYQWGQEQREERLARIDRDMKMVALEAHKATDELARRSRESATPVAALSLQVFGSNQYNPALANTYRAVTHDAEGYLQPARVGVRLFDGGKDQPVFEQNLEGAGDIALTLPAGLPVSETAQVVFEARAAGSVASIAEVLHKADVGYVTRLTMNKMFYHVGDVLFFQSVTLEKFSLKPAPPGLALTFTIIDEQGKAVLERHSDIGEGGVSGGTFAIENVASGKYSLQVRSPASDVAISESANFEIAPLESLQFHFDRARYNGGDTVNLQLQNAMQSPTNTLANQPITTSVYVDGKQINPKNGLSEGVSQNAKLDALGNSTMQIRLPKNIENDNAIVEVQVDASPKKVSQAIPVVPSRVGLGFYPEGGELIAGVANQVYYQVLTPGGEPLDEDANIVIRDGDTVIHDARAPKGCGVFSFTPRAAGAYRAQVTKLNGSSSIDAPFAKNPIHSDGVALHVPVAVGRESNVVDLQLRVPRGEHRFLVQAVCRGESVGYSFLEASAGESATRLPLASGSHGVIRITVYEAEAGELTPRAERLIYRIPEQHIDVTFAMPDRTGPFGPGQSIQASVRTTDALKNPLVAWTSAMVVEERYRPSSETGMAGHFFFKGQTPDVQDGELLLDDSPAGRQALDLFLGTHGWRRFVSAEPTQLAMAAQSKTVSSVMFFSREAKMQRTVAELDREGRQAASARVALAAKTVDLAGQQERLMQERTLANADLESYRETPALVRSIALASFTFLFFVIGITFLMVGVVKLVRRSATATRSFGYSFAGMGLCLLLFFVGSQGPSIEEGRVVENIPAPRTPQGDGVAFAPAPVKAKSKATVPPVGAFALAANEATVVADNRKIRSEPLVVAAAPRRDAASMVREGMGGQGPDAAPRGMMAQSAEPKAATDELQNRFTEAKREQQQVPNDAASPGMVPRMMTMPMAPDNGISAKGKAATAPAGGFGGGRASQGLSTGAGPTMGSKATSGAVPFRMKSSNVPASPLAASSLQSLVLREYAFRRHATQSTQPDTLLWTPLMRTTDGAASLSFDLGLHPTTYRVIIDAHDAEGRLGSYVGRIEVGSGE